MSKKVTKVSIPDCDLKDTVEAHINQGYELLGFSYTGGTMSLNAGVFQEVVLLFSKAS